MSTCKWESVTWEWLEREILDCLLLADKRRHNSGALARLLIERPKPRVSSAPLAPKQTPEHTDG